MQHSLKDELPQLYLPHLYNVSCKIVADRAVHLQLPTLQLVLTWQPLLHGLLQLVYTYHVIRMKERSAAVMGMKISSILHL